MQKNILEYLENTVQKFPNKIAIIDQNNSITFSDLQKKSQNIAAYLQSKCIDKNLPIGVFLPKSIDAIESFFGILYNNDFYVPIDTKNPNIRVKSIIKNIGIKYIITDSKHVNLLNDFDVEIILLEDIKLEKKLKFDYKNFNLSIDTDILHVLNTSGSTGVPKGVTISHRSIIDYIDWIVNEYKYDHNLIIGNQSPLNFDISTSDIFMMLATGAKLILIDEKLFMFPLKLIEFLEREKINFIFWVPSILSSIAKFDLLKNKNLDIKNVWFGGELMPTKHFKYWKKNIPDAIYVNTGGATEVGVVCTHYKVDREFNDDEILPIGHPCKNMEAFILDNNNHIITNFNTVGELCIRGSALAIGYYNNPDKTAESFIQNPLNKAYAEKIYRTGDLAYYNDRGELMYKGRKDFQIKHMGYRIELGEIETAILGINGIDNACVLYDTEIKSIVLIYETTLEIEQKDILLGLHSKLPKYMLPSKCIKLDSMPLNVNGKIDRNKLKGLINSAI